MCINFFKRTLSVRLIFSACSVGGFNVSSAIMTDPALFVTGFQEFYKFFLLIQSSKKAKHKADEIKMFINFLAC